MNYDCQGGVFQEWFNSISNLLKQSGGLKEISSQFAKLKSDDERIVFGLSLASVEDTLVVEPSFSTKSGTEATRLRNEGNKLYQKGKYHEALEVYFYSILNAPFSSKGHELSLAYANSSAVLFNLKRFHECLRGIQLALSNGYPEELRYKVFDRQGKCFVELGKFEEARTCFGKAKQALNGSSLDEKKKDMWYKDLEVEICRVQEDENSKRQTSTNKIFMDEVFELPKLTHGHNTMLVSASCAIDIVTSSASGRHLVATRNIDVGDILVIEKPFASVLLPCHVDSHCYHCLTLTSNVIPTPCHQCSMVRYCSESCAHQSWESYHSIECRYLDLLYRAGLDGNALLAFRIVTKAGYEFLKEFRHNIQRGLCIITDREAGCDRGGVYDSSSYLPIYCLVTHSSDRSISDLFRRTMVAILLLKILQGGGFFGKMPCSQEDLAFIGGLILRHLQSNPCNAHEISELQLNPSSVATSETQEIAAGIYATLSLLNHSCDPSVTRNFYGDTCVLRAIKNIPSGHEVADNYGTLCALTVKAERQEKLASQYYFTCQCDACENNFPLYSEIQNSPSSVFKCSSCCTSLHHLTLESIDHESDHVPKKTKGETVSAICPSCHYSNNLKKMKASLKSSEELYQKAMDSLLQEADAQGTVAVLESHLRLLEKLVCHPCRDFNNCQEAIKQCYNMMANCRVVTS